MLHPDVLSKLCDADDFFDPSLRPHLESVHQLPPNLQRKQWEYAVIARAMALTGSLREDADFLGIACHTEPMIYLAANHVRSVIATDLYAGTKNTDWVAGQTTEADVYESAPFPYRRDRLRVATMDMRKLDVPDESVDLVWSCSSIEHVESIHDIERSVREVARVLRPGGIHVFTSEWKLTESFSYFPRGFIFDRPLLERVFGAVPLEPVGPFDLSCSRHDLNSPVWSEMQSIYLQLPHLVVFARGVLNTSFVMTLRKSSKTGHKIDFINHDPALEEWMLERFRKAKEVLATPQARARMLAAGTVASWFARAHLAYAEWKTR